MIIIEQTEQKLLLNLQEAKDKITHYNRVKDTYKGQRYYKLVKEDKEVKESRENWEILKKIRFNIKHVTKSNYNDVKLILKEYYGFLKSTSSDTTFSKYFGPIFIDISDNLNKAQMSFSMLNVSLSASTSLNEALDNVQSVVEFYDDPNNMEALQKLQKDDKQAVLQIYNIGKDFLKYSKDIDKNNLKRAQEVYSAYLKLLDDLPGSYSRYFEPLAENLGKALVEKEDELSPQSSATPPPPPSSGGTGSKTPSTPSAAKPPTPIPPGPVKPIGVTGTGTPKTGTKPTPKRDYKTLLATDDKGGSLYFVRIGPGNYRPAVQADKDAGVQLFARNPNPAARMVYPFIKIQNMPTRRASPV